MVGGIVMLEGPVRISLQEGYHMREEDVFPVTHSIEFARKVEFARFFTFLQQAQSDDA